ncbi:MAG: acyl-CoA dehydrogenase family protein [Myxococcota bacterium]
MNFGFTDEQELLRNEVRKFLDASCPLEQVRKITEEAGGPGFSRDHWQHIADLGWLGLAIPELHGGAGLGWVDLVVVLEEMGRSLFPSPFVSNTLAAHAIRRFGSAKQQSRWLPRLGDGSLIGTVALLEEDGMPSPDGVHLAGRSAGKQLTLTGEKWLVGDAAAADLVVVAFRKGKSKDLGLAVVERGTPGLAARDLPGIDLTKRLGRLELDRVKIPRDAVLPKGSAAAIQHLFDVGALAVTAEAVGGAEAALALTAGYAKERIQFKRPIGTFQGVKHPLAEMYVDVQSVQSLVYYAAWCVDHGKRELPLAVSRAKAYASEALPRLGIDTIQLHGGIGYTWEYDAHLYLKRAKWLRPAFGDADWHYERVASLGGL